MSRLSRAGDGKAFIKDLVYSGGRFVSVSEGIDTNDPGWELKVGVLDIHHSQTVANTSGKVRNGQMGRVLADDSAGDHPFGFESYYHDEDWQLQLTRRGPKPKKGLRVYEPEARWVRQIFGWFNAVWPIGQIARELTRLAVPKGHRASTAGWHPQQVHRILNNKKYVGEWTWGATKTLTNAAGDKKQVAADKDAVATRSRPHLRIVEQAAWDAAQVRTAELRGKFGLKPGQKDRGPKPPIDPCAVYPRTLLGGLLRCGSCGGACWYKGSGNRQYYVCAGVIKGTCVQSTHVPAERAQKAVIDTVTNLLNSWPDWMEELSRRLRDAIAEMATQLPLERVRDEQKLQEVVKAIANISRAVESQSTPSPKLLERLGELEVEERDVELRLKSFPSDSAITLPGPDWVRAQLKNWTEGLQDGRKAARVLREAISSLTFRAVVAPGKTRGFARLQFQLRQWPLLLAALDGIPPSVKRLLTEAGQEGEAPIFTIDLGEPTVMDRWAPQIAWRTENVTWEDIVRRTGMDLNRVWIAWKRHVGDDDEADPTR